MSLSRDEAVRALEEIGEAGRKMRRIGHYADMAPCLILWGLIWLIANLVTEFDWRHSALVWLIGQAIGTPLTLWFVIRNGRRVAAEIRQDGGSSKAFFGRFALLGATIMAFVTAVITVVGPLSVRQGNALISLFVAFGYALAGVWAGWRFVAIGAATAAAILFGYLGLERHYFLWMGLVGGGALLAGGLWLRKA